MGMLSNVTTGNAHTDGQERRGWFVGSFITPSDSPRSTAALEVKWGVHEAGDRRTAWTEPAETTTLSILVSGRFCLQFPDGEIVLVSQGDYALWLPGVAHCWWAEADSVVVTVRW
jgi:quercetin dioxygenase-like cupin family protein